MILSEPKEPFSGIARQMKRYAISMTAALTVASLSCGDVMAATPLVVGDNPDVSAMSEDVILDSDVEDFTTADLSQTVLPNIKGIPVPLALYGMVLQDSIRLSQLDASVTSEEQPAEEPAGPVVTVGKSFEIPKAARSFKSWMGYKAITSKRSLQYKLQQEATTDEFGFRRYNGYYMIALGTYYTGRSCGKYFRITLDTGVTFDAITGDVKSDAHTDSKHQHRNGNVIEFIVDSKGIERTCKRSGDMSKANNGMFSGKIVKIEELLVQ